MTDQLALALRSLFRRELVGLAQLSWSKTGFLPKLIGQLKVSEKSGQADKRELSRLEDASDLSPLSVLDSRL
jgi:hypothetical protein